jgi:hypothetical protein
MKYLDGKIYSGNWLNDKYEGKGRLTNDKGEVYEGDFLG